MVKETLADMAAQKIIEFGVEHLTLSSASYKAASDIEKEVLQQIREQF